VHTCIGKTLHDEIGGNKRKTCWLKCQAIGVLLTHSHIHSLMHSFTHTLTLTLSLSVSHAHTVTHSRGQASYSQSLFLLHKEWRAHSFTHYPAALTNRNEGTLTLTSRSHTEWRVHSFSPPNLNAEWRAHLLQLSPSLSHTQWRNSLSL
jgi:hypothetical protein